MSFNCCFKYCKQLVGLSTQSARVEIKSIIPSSGLSKHKESLLVSWKKNGEAIFHPECWTLLLSISRKRGSDNRKRKSSIKPAIKELVMLHSEKVMIKQANKTVEKHDSAEEIQKMALKVAEMILKSKHCVFFTGAGISTSAGLGDFRGKGGKWTEQDREAIDIEGLFEDSESGKCEASPEKILRLGNGSSLTTNEEITNEGSTYETSLEGNDDVKEEEDINYEELRPTFTHEAISKLIQLGHLKYLISQNCDGLHLLSGLPSDKISELHGNVFVEKCEKCDKQYERPHYVCDDVADMYLEEISDYGKSDTIAPKFMKKCDKCGLSHRTGRKCDDKKCKGFLMDTIINFGDHLEESILDKAFEAADSCDLMICLGTTLTVTPANELVDYVRMPQRIVICNRQPTEKDELCQEKDRNGKPLGVRVYGDCDVFMKYLMSTVLGQKQYEVFVNGLNEKASLYNDIRKVPANK